MNVKRNKKIRREPGKKQMGFFGLLVDIQSTIGIYEDYVRDGPLDEFYTFQYSQDHLETYFSLVRGSLGANTNPNVQQFQSAYRKLLFCTPHISGDTNCNTEFPDALLEVSSAPQHQMPSHIDTFLRAQEIEILVDYDTLIGTELEPYEQHISALIASNIESDITRSIKARSVAACQDCPNIFNENIRIIDSFIAKKQNRGQPIIQPCSSTMNIVLASNEIIRILHSIEHTEFESMIKTIFSNLDIDSLYGSSQFDTHDQKKSKRCCAITHKEEFILNIVQKYMNMKSRNIGARITIEEQGETIQRRKVRRAIILAGQ